ncbi:ATP-dependent DNA ligase [Candidatus Woesearchaeota archaeon]|jgi:DNA ligase 1|nr:ATP-dependent DNA ligase [Candidatus Woesearchaeota archaeon]MBT6519516.1 ATP-dependent DNA ligase [Candidatus Woesearchaeota archaeon]MBT7367407.1 ATP-dependent DNA ligase [Candidatus Woesearchaeota archaeon]
MHYKELVELYEKIESTSKRLEKTYLVSKFLKKTIVSDLSMIILLLQGRIFPSWDERKIGVATKMVIKAISKSTGRSVDTIEETWKKMGDLGRVAEELVKTKRQVTLFQTELNVKKVFDNMRKLTTLEGTGSVDHKVGLISELLTSASPTEARYIVRNVLEDLRVGIGEGIIRDAIVWANFEEEIKVNYDSETKAITPDDREQYNKFVNIVQEAFDVVNDFAKVARIAKEEGVEGLKKLELSVGNPIKVMLYQKVTVIADAFEKVGKPAALEFKYDGFRMQIHKFDGKIILYTRRLEDVTTQFPEVVEYVKENIDADSFILDSEAVGYDQKTKKYLPFQKISQRIKRKYNIGELANQFPVELNVFDIMNFNGENIIKKPFKFRREILEKIIKPVPYKIIYAKQIITSDEQEAQNFYEEALAAGEEGIMMKNLDGIYKPGSRVGYGVKVKPVMESLDLVIVAAEWGTGKRGGWLTSYTLACVDPDTGEFLEIGKVGTGIKELKEEGTSFGEMTELLKPHIIKEKGREVKIKPVVVIEVNYEEIQHSPNYSSGFALRFPRLIRLREDRRADEVSDIELIEDLFHSQRGRG